MANPSSATSTTPSVLRAFWKAKYPHMAFEEFRKLDLAKQIAVTVLSRHPDKDLNFDLELDSALSEAAEDLRVAEKAKDPHRVKILQRRIATLHEARRRSGIGYVSVSELR